MWYHVFFKKGKMMGPQTEKLVLELDACVLLLQSCSEKHWTEWLEKCGTDLKTGDFSGIERLLGAYGGMGSINDLVLHPMNGHTMEESQVKKSNELLRDHLSNAYSLAQDIKKNAIIG
jgi:hypothetical protein